MYFIINKLQTHKFLNMLYSQSIAIFRTWVPSAGYTSRESLNRHYFLVCNAVLQHLHPLRPKTAKIESRPQARHWRSHKTVAEGDRPSAIVENHS
jgi:hypothetical protein